MIRYSSTQAFEKDLRKLSKKFPSLIDDLETAKTFAIELCHIGNINKQAIFAIPNYCREEIKMYKLKKFACRSLKGRGVMSGIRIIYAFDVRTQEVCFVEMYFKGESEMEDKGRMREYLDSCSV